MAPPTPQKTDALDMKPRDAEIMVAAFKAMVENPKFNYDKLAELAGFNGSASANVSWNNVRRKYSLYPSGVNPSSPAAKGKNSTPRKRKAAGSNSTPSKKQKFGAHGFDNAVDDDSDADTKAKIEIKDDSDDDTKNGIKNETIIKDDSDDDVKEVPKPEGK
ncbi:Uu.00g011460.m01.CDS01 [Anthostomella pinea]|uniref:Uu.00g011460.m01.CDS01 n=1 Tax=Anthostomella pinea TaxID=933095 RepID=A0AAI8VXS1_9PEZI|nr:Uu.00g011460.m01.CDS01 [Anthostomella pinea]